MLLTRLALIIAGVTAAVPQRPVLTVGPKTLATPFPASPARNASKVCTVAASSTDASPSILQAAQACNNGGTVVFPAGQTFVIGSPLDLTFLKHVDIFILGTVALKDDPAYWKSHLFVYAFQDSRLAWRFGGEDVNIYGLGQGTIDGRGQTWWTAWHADSSILRPHLFGTDGLKGGSISGLKMINSPNWFNLIANSSDVLITGMNLNVVSDPASPAKNTDGWDTYRSSNIVIQDSVINNTDDCISFKPNSTQIIIQNLKCNGSHGISVGSLGQYLGQTDIVQDVYVYNTTMSNASDGARIKVWPGAAPGSDGKSGGGLGRVQNVTYDTFSVSNVDYAIELTQCYSAKSQSLCQQYPASLIIEDIVFKNFSGTTSAKYDPISGSLVCSSANVCMNIRGQNINVKPRSGKTAKWTCTNIDKSLIGVACA
ncbi:polygalacturonase [Elsinoe ampelina]|uniref:galacturonan 1,4-alpha-galacturonidase n=1 Tax=Elsinoe ampelina TaxID=302913 RepID=A0A6A6GCA6_9PEZI|nr:polygalacturonase [Elsinoe ampelina]